MRKTSISAAVLIVSVSIAQAGILADLSGDRVIDFQTAMDMPLMTVGNLSNADDTHGAGYGGVDYQYSIGKFEVTAGQYTEFLNAVAATDTHGLYNANMADPTEWTLGCNIQRSGSSGSYTYSVAPDWEDRPVNWVDWGDAARFANWLTNDMPTGAQDLTTTEDGSYFLNGATGDTALLAVSAPNAAQRAIWEQDLKSYYLLPTEDEWYKAAYHKADGVTGNYFDYPTSSNAAPDNTFVDPDPGNHANFYDGDDTIGSPYYRTEVGEFENSPSPYGTFDMGGNIAEWNNPILYGSSRGARGGSFYYDDSFLQASSRDYYAPSYEDFYLGFRVSHIPEPATLLVMAAAGLPLLLKRKRKSRA